MENLKTAAVVGIRTLGDDLLAAIAPLGMALAAGTAVVIDLDPAGPPYPGERSLAELIEDGPRRPELRPERSGVALVRNGGASVAGGLEVIDALAAGWPTVVVRVGTDPVPFPVVPVVPLWPGFMAPTGTRAAVWQRVGAGGDPPGPGPALPPPGRSVVASLLAGKRPRRSRWVRAWARVWELPWR